MSESSWKFGKFSPVYLVWTHCAEQAFCVFSRLQRSVGICFICISNLVLAVIWRSQCRSETAVENRVEGSGDAEPYLHQPWPEETEKQRPMGGGPLAHRPCDGRGREDVPYGRGQDAPAGGARTRRAHPRSRT